MMYKCKILEHEFLEKFNDYIETSTSHIKDETERNEMRVQKRNFMYHMWNNPTFLADRPEVKRYYEDLGLYTPRYSEMLFVAVGKGFHNPRIRWMGEVTPINNIDDIFSYKLEEI